MTAPLDLRALREAAERATRGAWHAADCISPRILLAADIRSNAYKPRAERKDGDS